MLGGIPFVPYHAEDHVRFLGGAGPDLLAVDDEFVAFDPGAGLETGEVRSRSGFGIALAPHHFARERRFDPAPPLLLGHTLEHGRHQTRTALIGHTSGPPGTRKHPADVPGFEFVCSCPASALFTRHR